MEIKMVNNTKDTTVFEVVFENELDAISNPTYAGVKHISITKGDNHTVAIFDGNGDKKVSFGFGKDGYTLISNGLQKIKRDILVLLIKNGVQIRHRDTKIHDNIMLSIPPLNQGLSSISLGGEHSSFVSDYADFCDVYGEHNILSKNIHSKSNFTMLTISFKGGN